MASGKRLVFCSRLYQAFIHLNCEFLNSVKRAWFSAYWHKCDSKVDSFLKVMLNHYVGYMDCNLKQSDIYCSSWELRICSWILTPS